MVGPRDRGQHDARRAGHHGRGEPVSGAGQPGAAPQGEGRDRAADHRDQQRAEAGAGVEAHQGAVERLVADVGDGAEPVHREHLGGPVPPGVTGQRDRPDRRASGEGARRGGRCRPAARAPQQRNEDQRCQLDRRGQPDQGAEPRCAPQRQHVHQDEAGEEQADLAEPQVRRDRRGQHQDQRQGTGLRTVEEGGDPEDRGHRGHRPQHLHRRCGQPGQWPEHQPGERRIGERRGAVHEVVEADPGLRPAGRAEVDAEVGEPLRDRPSQRRDHGDGGDRRGQDPARRLSSCHHGRNPT